MSYNNAPNKIWRASTMFAPSSEATDRLQRRKGPRPLLVGQPECRSRLVTYLTGSLHIVSPQDPLFHGRPRLDVGIALAYPQSAMQLGRQGATFQAPVTPKGQYKSPPGFVPTSSHYGG